MKQRRRRIGFIVFIIILVVGVLAVAIPYAYQHYQARRLFSQLFEDIRDHDVESMCDNYYGTTAVDARYQQRLLQYKLLGYEIVGFSNEPFPLDSPTMVHDESDFPVCTAYLYYKLTPELKAAKGNYAIVTHPVYGKCVKVTAELDYLYHPLTAHPLELVTPDTVSDDDWAIPYTGPLQ